MKEILKFKSISGYQSLEVAFVRFIVLLFAAIESLTGIKRKELVLFIPVTVIQGS